MTREMTQVLIQHLLVDWTKLTRGGVGARKRSALPRAAKVPPISNMAPFVLHRLLYLERDDFRPASTLITADSAAGLAVKVLEFSWQDSRLSVRFYRDGFNAATPSAYPFKNVFTLQPQEWGRLEYNGRYSGMYSGEWWYEQHVYNIGLFDNWKPNVFVKTAPVSEFSELAQLR